MSTTMDAPSVAMTESSSGQETWNVRDYRPDHLEGVVRVWREWTSDQRNPVYTLAETVSACDDGLGVVVTDGGRVIGAAVARVDGDRAWILLFAQDPAVRDQGLGSALLTGLEARLATRNVFRLSALLPQSENRLKAFRNSDYTGEIPLWYFDRQVPVHRSSLEPLTSLGGALLPRDLWKRLAGMADEKALIESRLIDPLAHADLAEEYGVHPPRAVVLFGPPGTGKTSFARAIASRLGWPFVELHPSRLASDAAGLAGALRARFLDIAELEHAVVFIDEVDEVAARRDAARPTQSHSVTNELLKSIPAFREREGRLLICATNFIRHLDDALLRHGRFDYVIPIGLPDLEARKAMWRRYLPKGAAHIDVDTLAQSSERFSPADIEFAARKAAQRAFDAAMQCDDSTGRRVTPQTAAYVDAIRHTRPTVSETTLTEFQADIRSYARI
ncbi:acetyltransferase (GNAT) family protein [Microcella alkaliphila]|uniref:Acetyltransferase (GNAT) family protein n=1 Tax=Microcella alkaliphila TaxID=279828 RepID=A0A4V2FND5_9MICO|nr:acetyltransferase (GNAT) family protein [Microcella alkaliphila]